jgi:hypothetical protein
MTGMFIGWPGVFLALALILTCNKWMYYIIYVVQLKKCQTRGRIVNINDQTEILNKKRKILNICTFIACISIIVPESVYSG